MCRLVANLKHLPVPIKAGATVDIDVTEEEAKVRGLLQHGGGGMMGDDANAVEVCQTHA